MSEPGTETESDETTSQAPGGEAALPPAAPTAKSKPRSFGVPAAIAAGVVVIVALCLWMYHHAASKVNKVALDSQPKPVTVVEARATTFRKSKRYVATIEPWLRAEVGPQLVSAYVDTVIYRPGAFVEKGDVLATLDCKTASAQSQAVAMQAKALEEEEVAIAKEAARLNAMLDGGFVPQNDVDLKKAEAAKTSAQILSEKAKLLGTSLEVNDCVMRAPFEGEIADRFADPGAFAKPGVAILSIVDRSTVRIAADVPETDFGDVDVGTPVRIHMLAMLGPEATITAPITRRVPAADPITRTVHVEIDVPDPNRVIPVGTTAELTVDYGDPIKAAELPLVAASVRGDKATVFVVENDVAHKKLVDVLGEVGGSVFVDPSLVGAHVVTEGRALLEDDAKVEASLATFTPIASSATGVKPKPEASL